MTTRFRCVGAGLKPGRLASAPSQEDAFMKGPTDRHRSLCPQLDSSWKPRGKARPGRRLLGTAYIGRIHMHPGVALMPEVGLVDLGDEFQPLLLADQFQKSVDLGLDPIVVLLGRR